MLNSDDLTHMNADLMAMRGDHVVSIVLRRGETTLAAQNVRIARVARHGMPVMNGQTEENRGQALIMGDVDLDVQAHDRFTYNNVLYRIVMVRPNRTVMTVAEAVVVE